MNCLNKIALGLLGIGTIASGNQIAERLDLKKLLTDPVTLEKLTIEHEPADGTAFFVYGSGTVLRQPLVKAAADVPLPTCRGSVNQQDIRNVVHSLIEHHFLDLPVRNYFFLTISDEQDDFSKALKLHSITVSDGQLSASRQFAAGVYSDHQEAIPVEFAAIEQELTRVETSALGGKPCRMAPRIPRIKGSSRHSPTSKRAGPSYLEQQSTFNND